MAAFCQLCLKINENTIQYAGNHRPAIATSAKNLSVALGATAIDSTPTISVGWRRVPIQPAKYLHLWLSVKLVPTGFQNSGPLFRSQRPDHFRRGDRTRRTSTHRGQKDGKNRRV